MFKARWAEGGKESNTGFAFVMFVGMIVHGVFAEVLNRAPGLVLSNVNYVKKMVFPLESMPLVATATAVFHAAVSFFVLIAAYVVFKGFVHWTAILTPLVFLPLVLLTLGQVVGIVTTVALFLSPVFYPIRIVANGSRAT